MLLPSGRRWFAETSAAPVCDKDGSVVGGIAVTLDVTERKRADETRRKLLEELRSAQGTLRADLDAMWAKRGVIGVLTLRGMAEPAVAEATYLLALCKHEAADRSSGRAERARATPVHGWVPVGRSRARRHRRGHQRRGEAGLRRDEVAVAVPVRGRRGGDQRDPRPAGQGPPRCRSATGRANGYRCYPVVEVIALFVVHAELERQRIADRNVDHSGEFGGPEIASVQTAGS